MSRNAFDLRIDRRRDLLRLQPCSRSPVISPYNDSDCVHSEERNETGRVATAAAGRIAVSQHSV